MGSKVMILMDKPEETTKSGIIIPDNAKEEQQRGTVHKVGAGSKDVVMEVEKGDYVLLGKYAGAKLEYEGVEYLLVEQGEILAII